MVTEESRKSPRDPTVSQRSPRNSAANNNGENIFSPRFKSVAAMAGWDEETLLLASLIVDDTPDREFKNRKRPNITFKTPPSNSRRKRRDQSRNLLPIPATVLNLDEEAEEEKEPTRKGKENETKKQFETRKEKEETEMKGNEKPVNKSVNSAAVASLPCLDKLREELSCAICLEICFEPSTTPCGHSFCKKCLRSAADKCGKRCPKCRQLISNGRSCTVNTVLWNTIQLLFPDEIEARKECSNSSVKKDTKSDKQDRDADIRNHRRRRHLTQDAETRPHPTAITRRSSEANRDSSTRRRAVPSQDEDAALALRLQREEFLEVVRRTGSSSSSTTTTTQDNSRISMSLARENLRAMASRAINVRLRHRAT